MKIRDQALFWIAAGILLVAFVWLFRSMLLPFVVGITIAYLLNPALKKLSKHSIPRTVAAVLILAGFLVLIAGLGILMLPPLYRELLQLAEQAPEYIDIVWNRLQPYVQIVEETVNEDDLNSSLREAIKANISGAFSAGSDVMGGLLNGGRAIFGLVTFLIITPLVAFFMMIEWQSIVSWVDEMLPRHSYEKVREILSRIDKKIAGFVRGQVMVAVSLGLLYAISLSIAGLQFGFLIGIAAGLLSVVPLFGSTVGLLVGVGVAWVQHQEISFVLIIAGIFLFGQFLEGNVISPKIMGDSVGLHPLWILFALMAGSTLFGIVGMVLAVPVAASVGVLIDFAVEQYKGSAYYE